MSPLNNSPIAFISYPGWKMLLDWQFMPLILQLCADDLNVWWFKSLFFEKGKIISKKVADNSLHTLPF